MKKLVCGCFGTIYHAKILKDGLMSSADRQDVTSEAVNVVAQHLLCQKEFMEDRKAGYKFDGREGKLKLALFDSDRYELVAKNGGVENA